MSIDEDASKSEVRKPGEARAAQVPLARSSGRRKSDCDSAGWGKVKKRKGHLHVGSGARLECSGRNAPASLDGISELESDWNDGTYKLAAFLQCAKEHRAQMLWLAQRMTHDPADAEDIVQDALLKAFKYLPRFRGDSQISTWLFVIVRNAGLEWIRSRKGREFVSLEQAWVPDDEPFVLDIPDPGRSPEQCYIRNEMREILHSEIDSLDSVCRSTIRMCALEESPYLQAADSLGASVVAIKSRMFRAKKMLRRAVVLRLGKRDESTCSLES